MKEYLKVINQDGLIYFDKFRIANIILFKDSNHEINLTIDVKTFDGEYSSEETKMFEKQLNHEIENISDYVWVELRDYPTKISTIPELLNNPINIERGYEIDIERDSIAHLYLGWSIELNQNKIELIKKDNEYYIKWLASSDDVNYYDERAKKDSFEMVCKVNLHHFEKFEDYLAFMKKGNEEEDKYYSILRIFDDQAIKGKDDYDVSFIQKTDSEITNAILAWENRNKI